MESAKIAEKYWKAAVALAMAFALVLVITLGFQAARDAGFAAGVAHVLTDSELFITDMDESFGNYDHVVYIVLDDEHYPHGVYVG